MKDTVRPSDGALEREAAIRQPEQKARRVAPLVFTRRGMVLADVFVLAITLLAVQHAGLLPASGGRAYVVISVIILLITGQRQLFRVGAQASIIDDLPILGVAGLLSAPVVHFAASGLGWSLSPASCLALAALAGGALAVERSMVRWRQHHLRLEGIGQKITLIVGAGHVGSRVAKRLLMHPEFGLQPIGFVDKEPLADIEERRGLPVLGSSYLLGRLIEEFEVDVVLVTFSTAPHSVMLDIVRTSQQKGVEILVVPRLFETVSTPITLDRLLGIPLVRMRPVSFRGANWVVKRALDVTASALMLLLMSPFLLLMALAVKLDSPGRVLFGQERVGWEGRRFTIYKFRTMVLDAEDLLEQLTDLNEAEGHLFKIRRDPRITRVGRLLRRWSLDELPQLINVLKGEMSLVGPRPSLAREVAAYDLEELRRVKGKPGVTGLAQISGRSDLVFEEMVELDRYYLENWSLGLDIRILWRTCFVVLARKGAY